MSPKDGEVLLLRFIVAYFVFMTSLALGLLLNIFDEDVQGIVFSFLALCLSIFIFRSLKSHLNALSNDTRTPDDKARAGKADDDDSWNPPQ